MGIAVKEKFVAGEFTSDSEPQTPQEIAHASVVTGEGIGQVRFRGNMNAIGVQKPTNSLPPGEDPAGWFLIGGQYVNCDGKTPQQLEEESPDWHKEQAAKARKEATVATNNYEKAARLADAQALDLKAAQARMAELEAALSEKEKVSS